LKYSWKSLFESLFSSSVAFLIMELAARKRRNLGLISVQGKGKNQLEQGQESVWDAPMSSHSSLLRNP